MSRARRFPGPRPLALVKRAEAPRSVTSVRYKVVETALVTDDELERIINERVGEGWTLDGIQFAMRESSKRPAMAFLLFFRPDDPLPPRAAAAGAS